MGGATLKPAIVTSENVQRQMLKTLHRRALAWSLGVGWEASVILLLIFQTAILAASAAWHTPTIDEPVHLIGGLRFWETGKVDINRGNPPLVDIWSSIPAALAHPKTEWQRFPSSFFCAEDFMRINGINGLEYIIWGRWMLLPIGALGGWACALWARQLYGRPAGLIAAILWSACPLLLANTELISGDVPSTVAAVWVMYVGWLWMRRPTWNQAILLGIVLGIAQLTKFVCVILYPALFYSWLLYRLVRPRTENPRSSWLSDLGQGIVGVMISIVIIDAGYCFDGVMQPLAKHGVSRYLSKDLSPITATDGSASVNGPWWAQVPVPLPLNYLGGANEISQLFETLHPTYFMGQWIPGGVWYYYLAGFLWKLPIATLLLFAIAIACSCVVPRLRRNWPHELPLAIAFVSFLTFVSCVTTVQYLRYAIPALPYLIIYASKAGSLLQRGPRILGVATAGLVTWSIAATMSIFPHQGSYFNELVGGPEHGSDYLAESSIDWGQDLFFLKAWLDEHADARPFFLAFMGKCNPRDVGISFELPPLDAGVMRGKDQSWGLVPGYYAISKSLLAGFEWPSVPDGNGEYVYAHGRRFSYLKACTLVGRAGHSILIYEITPAKIEEFRIQAESRWRSDRKAESRSQ
jgi:hypothetical protein